MEDGMDPGEGTQENAVVTKVENPRAAVRVCVHVRACTRVRLHTCVCLPVRVGVAVFSSHLHSLHL